MFNIEQRVFVGATCCFVLDSGALYIKTFNIWLLFTLKLYIGSLLLVHKLISTASHASFILFKKFYTLRMQVKFVTKLVFFIVLNVIVAGDQEVSGCSQEDNSCGFHNRSLDFTSLGESHCKEQKRFWLFLQNKTYTFNVAFPDNPNKFLKVKVCENCYKRHNLFQRVLRHVKSGDYHELKSTFFPQSLKDCMLFRSVGNALNPDENPTSAASTSRSTNVKDGLLFLVMRSKKEDIHFLVSAKNSKLYALRVVPFKSKYNQTKNQNPYRWVIDDSKLMSLENMPSEYAFLRMDDIEQERIALDIPIKKARELRQLAI